MFKKLAIALTSGLFCAASAALATPINTPGTFTPSAPIVDFESFAVGTAGPITVGDMTVSAPGQTVRAQGYTQYPDIFEGQYFGFAPVVFTLDFAVDMMAVGFGLFDPNFANTKIEAYDRGGSLVETLFPPTGPTGGVFSTYVGFSRTEGDIAKIVVTPQSGDLLAVDNIAWKTAMAAVPVPASIWLMVAGLGGLGALRRSRRS